MINIFLILNILMSISIHIPFYNPNPQKKEGYRQLTRYEFLKENIENLKKLSIKSDIFIHTHNNFLDDKNLDAQIINHQISEAEVNKGLLTWLSRPLMEKQKNNYDYFMYLEHDIKFSENNLQYLYKYDEFLNEKKFHLGFLVYEINHNDKKKYSIHLTKKLNKFIVINYQKFFINDFENYCCFWVYNQKIFKSFIQTKWWKFKEKPSNFRHYYGFTERSSIGYHALNISFFKTTLLPEIDNKPESGCFVEHMTNNYFEKFTALDKKKYYDIRAVCKYDDENLYEELKDQKEIRDNFFVIKFFKNILWKFRFLTRLLKK